MLSSIASSTASSVMVLAEALGAGGALIAVLLIALLSARELVSSTTLGSPRLKMALDLAIVPLLAAFVLDVVFMITR